MLNVSAKWQRAVMLDNDINVNCFADIVTASGEKIPISDSELWANGFEVNDSTSSNGTFTIGALIAGKLKIKLNNIYEDYSKYDFDKASVTAYVSKSFSDGTSEKLKIGEYRVSETSYDGSLITLTCLDNINNFNREYDSNLSYPTTAYEVVRDACIKCDVPFTMARFDNSDYVINEIPSDNQKLTYGQVIAYDDTLYYGMNYEQFLILRLAGDEQKINKMQKRIDELEDKFSRLCQKLGIDESEV